MELFDSNKKKGNRNKPHSILPLKELIKALDEKGIKYDEGEISDAYLPLEDVKACLDNEESIYLKGIPNQRSCPLCGKASEDLIWFNFRSPKWTWDKLMGCGGPMSICPDCGCLVDFLCFIQN